MSVDYPYSSLNATKPRTYVGLINVTSLNSGVKMSTDIKDDSFVIENLQIASSNSFLYYKESGLILKNLLVNLSISDETGTVGLQEMWLVEDHIL